MREQLEKAISLAKKTGDRLIVFDTSSNVPPFVVMSLEEYEKLVIGKSEVRNLTEEQLLDKINRDIAIWKSEQELSHWQENSIEKSDESLPSFKPDENGYETNAFISSISSSREGDVKPKSKARWAIPRDRLAGAEEVIEEDRQYLQTVNF